MGTALAEAALGTLTDLGQSGDEGEAETIVDTEAFDLAPAADLDDLFAEPDLTFDDEVTPVTDDLTEDELRVQLAKANRQVEHERQLRVQTGKKAWAAEAEKHFPYSQPEQITSESRREFLAEAKRRDQAFRAQAAPLIEKMKEREAATEARIRAEVEEKFGKGWGTVTVNSSNTGAAGATEDATARLEKANKRLNLKDATLALMDLGPGKGGI